MRSEWAWYIKDCLRYLKPPENITVSEWAEKYRKLDSKTSAIPGSWRNSKTPYLVGIMDELTNYETEEIAFCKCTQVGGTEALQNMIGWIAQQDPAPTMIVYPTDKLAESVSENRLQPMFKTSPSLRRLFHEMDSQKLELQFDGMYLTLAGSNSPSSLASKAIKYLMLDEVDKYPGASKKEADPISLARERTKTFTNRKIFLTSTPTVKENHIWKALETSDIEKHFFVPCPHCGEFIELQFKNLRWPTGEDLSDAERADLAAYACPECGCSFGDHQKIKAVEQGEWRIVRQNGTGKKKVGFWINTLYSPFVRFSEIALEFMNAKDDPERLQNFVNSWLGEPWEDTQNKTDADMILARQTETAEYVVPEWAKLLTAGVDVQQNRLYYTIRAWGDYITSQCITRGEVSSFADIYRVMNLQYQKEDGTQMLVELCLVDSGYNADSTYDFCADNSDWAYPVKGSSNTMQSHYRISSVNKAGSRAQGMELIITDGDRYKDMIANRMRKPNGTGSWMVFNGIDYDYAAQVTAEHKIQVKSGGKMMTKWVPKRAHTDNHYLDCEVYAMAAADIRGVRTMHLDNAEPEYYKNDHNPVQSEESWIGTHEGWI